MGKVRKKEEVGAISVPEYFPSECSANVNEFAELSAGNRPYKNRQILTNGRYFYGFYTNYTNGHGINYTDKEQEGYQNTQLFVSITVWFCHQISTITFDRNRVCARHLK